VRNQLEKRTRHSLEYKEHKPIIESEIHSVADYLLGPVDQREAQACDLKQLGEWTPASSISRPIALRIKTRRRLGSAIQPEIVVGRSQAIIFGSLS
jgi:hypothetical protein